MTSPDNIKELRELLSTEFVDLTEPQIHTMLCALPGVLDEVEASKRERDELASGIAERDALLARCEGLEGERNALSCALAFIRDSTFRDAASLRAHADAVLNKYRAGDFAATRTTGGDGT